jgi:hypothetical protein
MMQRPRRLGGSACALTVARYALLALLVLPAGASGCNASGENAPQASAKGRALLRCGDFIHVEEIRALGLDASHFSDNDTQPDAVLGVRCDLGPKLSATIFYGEQFAPMAAELKAAVANGQIQSHPGPTIGRETYWTMMGKLHGMLFLASNQRYAGSLAGRDQALLERLAQQIDVNMGK